LDRQSGERVHLAFALASLADLLRVRGELDAARDTCTQAQKAELGMPSHTSAADFECAQIALDRGEVDQAAAAFTRIEHDSIAAKDDFDAANSQLVLGQIAMGRSRWADAQNDIAARDAAMKRASDLRSQVTARQEVLYLDIALTEMQAQLGQPAQA